MNEQIDIIGKLRRYCVQHIIINYINRVGISRMKLTFTKSLSSRE